MADVMGTLSRVKDRLDKINNPWCSEVEEAGYFEVLFDKERSVSKW